MATKRTVLVTGAEGALGAAVCESFLGAGFRVVGTYLKTPGPNTEVDWRQVDVTRSDSVRSLAAESFDTLVHCAGGFRWKTLEETSDADIDFLFNLNLRSALIVTRELLPAMKRAGFGRIVLVGARSTQNPPMGVAAYAASKAGINMLVASLADEVRKLNINVNAVLPTMIDTAANRKDMPGADFSQWVTPRALADIIVKLTQPWGDPIHGALLPVSGRL